MPSKVPRQRTNTLSGSTNDISGIFSTGAGNRGASTSSSSTGRPVGALVGGLGTGR